MDRNVLQFPFTDENIRVEKKRPCTDSKSVTEIKGRIKIGFNPQDIALFKIFLTLSNIYT